MMKLSAKVAVDLESVKQELGFCLENISMSDEDSVYGFYRYDYKGYEPIRVNVQVKVHSVEIDTVSNSIETTIALDVTNKEDIYFKANVSEDLRSCIRRDVERIEYVLMSNYIDLDGVQLVP
jgi:hypothetical protein